MKIKKLLSSLVLGSLLGSGMIAAAPALTYFDISLPASRENGDPLPSDEISSIRFYGGCTAGQDPQAASLLFTAEIGQPTQSIINYTDGGAYSFCITIVDTDGQEGLPSDPYQLTFNLIGRPGAGNINSITIECTQQRCRISRN